MSTAVLFPCAAPAGAAVLELRYTTTEPTGDRATLESDLSAAPEAEMGWVVRTSPAFRFADVSLISARKRCRNSDQFTSLFRPFARTCRLRPVSHLSAFFEA